MDTSHIIDDNTLDEEYMHIYRTVHTIFPMALDESKTSLYSPEELEIEGV